MTENTAVPPAEDLPAGVDNETGERVEIPEGNDPAVTGIFPADAYPDTDDSIADGTQVNDDNPREGVEEGDPHEGEADTLGDA